MAFLPCDRGHPNPRGRNTLVYSAYGSGGDFSRFRLRLCQLHAAVVWQNLAEFKVTDPDSVHYVATRSDRCITCKEPVGDDGWQVFATAYPAQDQREDYWAKLHRDCRFPDWLLNTGDNGNRLSPDWTEIGAPQRP